MWKTLKSLLPKPPALEERFRKLVLSGLESDAKLLASGLDAANRPAAGSWGTTLIECEIASLRAWTMCAALAGSQQDGEVLIRSHEASFRSWLEQKRQQPLKSFSAFTRASLPDTLTYLSEGWRRYDDFLKLTTTVSPETLADLIALFWGRCIEGYTNRKPDGSTIQSETEIDRFIPRYVSFQLQLASAARR